MSTPTFDAVIAGGGIVGCACALGLARAGLRTAVVEPGPIGGGATAAGMGHIVVMDDSEAQFALTSYSRALWKTASATLAPDIEYQECGTLWVASDEEEMEEVRRKQRYLLERSIACEVLGPAELLEAEPRLRRGLAGALLVPGDGVVYPPCAARFFLEQSGARWFRSAVTAISDEGAALADGTRVSAGLAINATGTAAPKLTPGIPVEPRKGHLVITDRYPGLVLHQLVELGYLKSAHSITSDSVAFNVQPRKTGQVLIGSSRQYGIEDPRVDTRMLTSMLLRSFEYVPALEHTSAIRCWTGFRAATPDKLPLIGPAEGFRRVYLATGHEGLGITTSLGTARLLADLVLSRDTAIPIAPYLPQRVPFVHA
jgi:D-hydroxyproline dehydrogenase subunit beta